MRHAIIARGMGRASWTVEDRKNARRLRLHSGRWGDLWCRGAGGLALLSDPRRPLPFAGRQRPRAPAVGGDGGAGRSGGRPAGTLGAVAAGFLLEAIGKRPAGVFTGKA